MTDVKIKDGEILFVYESKMANPNGDPDNENVPRMDYETDRNLVSDVRLKRYIRDYFISNFHDESNDVFVKRVDRVQNATERAKEFEFDKSKILKKCIDIRMFGATIAIKEKSDSESGEAKSGGKRESKKGSSIALTGPIQFTWGYSLNQVQLMNSYSITTTFASKEGKTQGSIGKDYRVYYSLMAFYGVISSKRALESTLSEDDLKNFDKAMLNSIQMSSTRTKIGQYPLLYIRTEYEKPKFIGDLRQFISFNSSKTPIRSTDDYSLNLKDLAERIKGNKECKKANIWLHSNLKIEGEDNLKEEPFKMMNEDD